MRDGIALGVAASLVLIVGGCASTGWDKAPATAQWIDDTIAATGHSELFENISDGPDAALRHRASGLECHFGNERGSLDVFEHANMAAGDDVMCSMWNGPIKTSLAATRYKTTPTLDAYEETYWSKSDLGFPGAKLFSEVVESSMEVRPHFPMPETRVRRITRQDGGLTILTREAVTVVNGWVIEELVSTPLDNAEDGEMYAQMHMVSALASMVAVAPQKP